MGSLDICISPPLGVHSRLIIITDYLFFSVLKFLCLSKFIFCFDVCLCVFSMKMIIIKCHKIIFFILRRRNEGRENERLFSEELISVHESLCMHIISVKACACLHNEQGQDKKIKERRQVSWYTT